MSGMSRSKGKRGERELAKHLTAAGFPSRRGVQFQGGTDSPDVITDCLPAVHWECKRVERGIDLYGWLAQARSDAGPDQLPIIAHRRNDSEWLAIMPLDVLLEILRRSDLVTGANT